MRGAWRCETYAGALKASLIAKPPHTERLNRILTCKMMIPCSKNICTSNRKQAYNAANTRMQLILSYQGRCKGSRDTSEFARHLQSNPSVMHRSCVWFKNSSEPSRNVVQWCGKRSSLGEAPRAIHLSIDAGHADGAVYGNAGLLRGAMLTVYWRVMEGKPLYMQQRTDRRDERHSEATRVRYSGSRLEV